MPCHICSSNSRVESFLDVSFSVERVFRNAEEALRILERGLTTYRDPSSNLSLTAAEL